MNWGKQRMKCLETITACKLCCKSMLASLTYPTPLTLSVMAYFVVDKLNFCIAPKWV